MARGMFHRSSDHEVLHSSRFRRFLRIRDGHCSVQHQYRVSVQLQCEFWLIPVMWMEQVLFSAFRMLRVTSFKSRINIARRLQDGQVIETGYPTRPMTATEKQQMVVYEKQWDQWRVQVWITFKLVKRKALSDYSSTSLWRERSRSQLLLSCLASAVNRASFRNDHSDSNHAILIKVLK